MAAASPLLQLPVLVDDLSRVEDALLASVVADDDFLTEVASHLILAGGKRVRPAFSITAAATALPAMSTAPDDVIMGAVSVELVHLGSLYHDDVMDEAATRRTVPSVNARWGNLKAILAGDYLLARASEIAASLGTEVAGLLAATIGRLCEGQILELKDAFNAERTEASYLASIDGKTASLLGTACRVGGIVSGLPRDHIDAVTTFGRSFGMAFQIVDDLLDVTSTDEELGKPAGHDLIEGTWTLPIIKMLATGGDEAHELRSLLARVTPADGSVGTIDDPETIAAARALLRSSAAVQQSLDVARAFVEEGQRALVPYAGTEATTALEAAAEHLLGTVNAAA